MLSLQTPQVRLRRLTFIIISPYVIWHLDATLVSMEGSSSCLSSTIIKVERT